MYIIRINIYRNPYPHSLTGGCTSREWESLNLKYAFAYHWRFPYTPVNCYPHYLLLTLPSLFPLRQIFSKSWKKIICSGLTQQAIKKWCMQILRKLLCVQTLRHSSHYGFHGINGKASLMKLHSFGRKSDDSLVNANSACCMPVYGLLLVPSSQH